jgi:hypothetical protein
MGDGDDVVMSDRRTAARLSCLFGKGCRWWVDGSDAAVIGLAWLNHSRSHWGLPPLEELP